MPVHTVEQGECLSSIAKRFGFGDFRTIWSRPENAKLRLLRPDPDLLLPGDRVFVPEKTSRVEVVESGKEHVFVLRRSSVFLELVLRTDGEPLANKRYSLTLGIQERTGTTDGEGRLRELIEPDAAGGTLRLEDPVLEWSLRFGHLDPATEATGVQGRLNNLGHPCGEADGIVGARTRAALRQFQSRHGLKPTGAIDPATVNALRSAHDRS